MPSGMNSKELTWNGFRELASRAMVNIREHGRRLRIGIMGSAGSGKTTLAHSLSSSLGIALIEEGVREWLTTHGVKAPSELSWDRQLKLQEYYLAAKMRNETA